MTGKIKSIAAQYAMITLACALYAVGFNWCFDPNPVSYTHLSMERLVTIRPWWKARAQQLQPPKQPRLWVIEKRTSSMAGMPSVYMGWTSRV